MARSVSLCLLALLLVSYSFLQPRAWEDRASTRREAQPSYVLPSGVSRILAVGNRGVFADFLFLRTMTFFGERFQNDQTPSEADWSYLIHSLDVVTDLDPYFLDPYVFCEGVLVWGANKIDAANRLLEKGIEYRTWEWRLPFYAGFNAFYFQHDFAQGSAYVMEAAKIPGSPDFLKPLAARLAYYGKRTQTGVLFLKQMLAETSNPQLRKTLSKRLAALEAASSIEAARERYRKDFGHYPEHLKNLVSSGYLEKLPVEPYGGHWGVLPNGRVFSTSKFTDLPTTKEQGGPQ